MLIDIAVFMFQALPLAEAFNVQMYPYLSWRPSCRPHAGRGDVSGRLSR